MAFTISGVSTVMTVNGAPKAPALPLAEG